MAKKNKDLSAPVVGIAIPCSGIRNKQLRKVSISNISYTQAGAGGKITIDINFADAALIREGEIIDKDFVFMGVKDGNVRGKPAGLEVELKNLVKDELRPAEAVISFKFGALKVGPGSGEKVGPGSGF